MAPKPRFMCYQGPAAWTASPSPGQGGIVIAIAETASPADAPNLIQPRRPERPDRYRRRRIDLEQPATSHSPTSSLAFLSIGWRSKPPGAALTQVPIVQILAQFRPGQNGLHESPPGGSLMSGCDGGAKVPAGRSLLPDVLRPQVRTGRHEVAHQADAALVLDNLDIHAAAGEPCLFAHE